MHSFNTSAERNKVLIIQLLDKCLGGNKIEPLWHTCLTLLGTCAKGVQYYCPSYTCPAIPYCTIFLILEACVRLLALALVSTMNGQPQTVLLNIISVWIISFLFWPNNDSNNDDEKHFQEVNNCKKKFYK